MSQNTDEASVVDNTASADDSDGSIRITGQSQGDELPGEPDESPVDPDALHLGQSPNQDSGDEPGLVLFYEGKPVVVVSPEGGRLLVTASGLVAMTPGSGFDEFYVATPEEAQLFQMLASDMVQADLETGGLSLSVQGLSLLSPLGELVGYSFGTFSTFSLPDQPASPPFGTLWELLRSAQPNAHTGDDLLDEGGGDAAYAGENGVLNLRAATEAMHVDLTVPEYHPASDPAKSVELSDSIVDVIGARNFDNVVTGDARANEITSGEHTDTLSGGGGDDVFIMNTNLDATDTIDGGGGDDTLRFTQSGANPTDALNGVTGVERVILGDADTNLVVTDNLLAPGQSLLLDASGIVSGGNLDFDGSAEGQGTFTIFGSAAGDRIIGGVGNDSLNGGAGTDTIDGGAGNDSLSGGAGVDTIDGGGGNDTIDGGAGADVLDGGEGTNTLSYASSASGVDVSLDAGSASGGDAQGDAVAWASFQNLLGSAAADTLEGRDGQANLIQGQGGDDTLQCTTGGDTLEGGAGNDTFLFGADPESGTTIDGGAGTDSLQATASVDYSDATITGVERLLIGDGQYARISGSQAGNGWTVVGTTGAQELRFGMDGTSLDLSALGFESWTAGEDAVTITGTGSDETITGSAAGDTITSGGGADVIHAGAGADTIALSTSPGSGAVLDGGAGDDVLSINGTVDLQSANITGIEHLNLNGSVEVYLAADQADGQSWDINGSAGSDVYIHGSTAADSMDLSSLDLDDYAGDTFAVYGDSGDDAITMGTNMSLVTFLNGGSGTDTLSFTSGATDDLDHVTNVETIILGDAATTLTLVNGLVASGQTVTIDAGGLTHAFTLDGSAETDGSLDIRGGSGNDDITGGAGNDTIEGGAGEDTLDGGLGADTLSYASSSSGVNVSLRASTASGGDAEGDTITGSSFQNLTGSEAGDVLEGRSGEASELRGLGGNDTLKYTTGATVIDGGSGTDTLQASASVDYSAVSITGVERVLIGSGQYAGFHSSQLDTISTVFGAAGAQELRVHMNGTSLDLSTLVFESWTDGEDAVTVTGTGSDETITGTAFGDTIESGGGADVIHAGAGNDIIALSSSPGSGAVIDGGTGEDTLVINTTGDVSLQNSTITNIENVSIDGAVYFTAAQAHEQSWEISGASGDALNIYGTSGPETTDLTSLDLSGFTGALNVSLDGGNDVIRMGDNMGKVGLLNGGSGTDTLYFTSGATTDLDGVSYVETIILGDVTTSLTLGGDSLAATDKTVTIDASGLTHTFTFDGGNETDGNLYILGGAGNDTITGGDHADANNDTPRDCRLVDGVNKYGDIINGGDGGDILDGGRGFDYVSYQGSDAGVTVHIDGLGINSGGWADGDVLSGFKGVIGSDHADTLYGSSNYGTALYGMGGDDHLKGEGADNVLCGGSGNDTIEVGTGFDTILYESYDEVKAYTDTITGFTSGMDKLLFAYSDFIGLKGDLDPVVNFFTDFDDVGADSCFIFENNTLYYDDDGTGSEDAYAVAVFDGGTVAYTDIEIV